MDHFRPFAVCVANLALIALLLALNACSGISSSFTSPAASYSLTATALTPTTVKAGSTSSSTIKLTPANGYDSGIALYCSAISGGSAAPVCSFSPNVVILSGTAAVTSTLTVSTTENTPGGSYTIRVRGNDANDMEASNGPQSLTLTTAAAIQRVVVIFQENRTPDNLFQGLCIPPYGSQSACGTAQHQYNIAQSGLNTSGQTITLGPIDLGTAGSNPQNYDLDHANSAFVAMYDGGKMEGANLISCAMAATGTVCPPNAQYMYVIPTDVAPYITMAQQYTFGDQMFQTNEGPSFPAHQFIYGGTSAPTATSTLFAAENPGPEPVGCIAPLTEAVTMINAAGSESAQPGQYPCFEHQTLSDLLDAKGLTWRYYAPSAGSIWTAPDAIQHVCQPQTVNNTLTCTGPEWTGGVVIPEWQILEDISKGQLAQVSWVIPDGAHSDHPLTNDGSGPSWVSSIVNAIGNSQYWANTAIIITWDDWGGWYDHVAPKVIKNGVSWGSGYVYGFRVPLIIVSPYTKTKYISHVKHDFGSILNFIETTYDLPSLGYADAHADDLSDCFDLTQSPIPFQTISAPVGAAFFINNRSAPIDPDDD